MTRDQVVQAQQGDRRALEIFGTWLQGKLVPGVMSVMGQTAEDREILYSEGVEAALLALPGYDYTKAEASTFFATVIRNRIVWKDSLLRRRLSTLNQIVVNKEYGFFSCTDMSHVESFDRLARLLSVAVVEQFGGESIESRMVELFLNGKEPHEVAERLGMSLVTLRKCRNRLKRWYTKQRVSLLAPEMSFAG